MGVRLPASALALATRGAVCKFCARALCRASQGDCKALSQPQKECMRWQPYPRLGLCMRRRCDRCAAGSHCCHRRRRLHVHLQDLVWRNTLCWKARQDELGCPVPWQTFRLPSQGWQHACLAAEQSR